MKRDKRRPHIKISLCMTIAFIFFFISGHSGGIGYKGADASSALAAETDVNQPSSSALAQEQCSALSAQQLVYRASVATTVTQLTSKLRVLPGGDVAKVEIPAIAPGNSVYCAKFIEGNATVRVITAISTGGQKTELTLGLPDIGLGRQQQKEIVLVSFPVDPKGQLKIDSPGVSVRQMVRVSDRLFSFFIALIFVVLAYVIAVVLQGRVGNKTWCIDPVYLTSGVNDKASLSQLQVFGFTLLVLGLLIFILFRTSELSDISQDILLLLGISAGGTVGSKVVGVAKKRLSSENSSWLRNHGWLTVYESGLGQSTDCKRARWGDLLKTDGSFDVYSFQLATFSVLVAFALLKIDLSALSTFSIPNNLLALLGLSNVVYIAGKAVTPNSVGELDKKVDELRAAEQELLTEVTAAVITVQSQQDKIQKAIATSPKTYSSYIVKAREAARMLKTIYGAEGTKFKVDPIPDSEILPLFPQL